MTHKRDIQTLKGDKLTRTRDRFTHRSDISTHTKETADAMAGDAGRKPAIESF